MFVRDCLFTGDWGKYVEANTDESTRAGKISSALAVIRYEGGTLVVDGLPSDLAKQVPSLVWDPRTLEWRAPARCYRELVLALRSRGFQLDDRARGYEVISWNLIEPITPRSHQIDALRAWTAAGKLGSVELPTGAGKTILAVLAIVATGRSTLVVVPTIDLMQQWEAVLTRFLRIKVGLLGGGSHEIEPITVATYDSALIHAERIGNRFGLLIFDEAHHLPAPQYQTIALSSLAPFRLGLSATYERTDGNEKVVYELVGALVYQGHIHEMTSTVLAPYEVVSIHVPMSQDENHAYLAARKRYTDFLKRHGIRMNDPTGWMDFVKISARTPDGREAMKAYREQKRLAQSAEGKLQEIWKILQRHRGEHTILFTEENSFAYRIGREFFLPVITHKTKIKDRKRFLDAFRIGSIKALATAKVLNEGVDVPEASVGVVVSGSGTVREHVQRLGRILRARPGKRAVLYEIISQGTSEYFVNQRRKQHSAYQGSTAISRAGGKGLSSLC